MTRIKKIFLPLNYSFIGIGIALISALILSVLVQLVNAGTIDKSHIVVQSLFAGILFSPIAACIATSLKFRFQNPGLNSFSYWVKASFINFLIVTILLSIIGLFITTQKDVLQQLFFERLYLLFLVPLLGLAISLISTLLLKPQ
ncbi:MAG: hypothetical protein CFE21_03560 [Bacteroidetes bacterium B1(2017)]|nr:MAG: hypothetical protein CFE21_03560 [Bacteroidetes bacterium B1(2017)]